MKKITVRILMCLMFVITLFGMSVPPAQALSAPSAASKCQCVVYVKNKYKLSGSAGYAKNMGVFLKARGFQKKATPSTNAIIIMKPAFGHGVDKTAGHVAIIHEVIDAGDSWIITVRGANQGGSMWTESNCTNVSFWRNIKYSKQWGDKYVEYWKK